MGLLPSAVGFLRSDVSGLNQPRDELRILAAAKRTGYDLRKTIVFSEHTEDRVHRLRVAIARLDVDTVIVPSTEHFDDHTIPEELLEVATVITVSPGNTWARTPRLTSEAP
ncbi:hypothetical protein IU500_06715 [Nocardia terpenica]|uniref:hypothetical protein n=1 Tax=Nocardia terpenica TaxID=455432 RepID=UPI00189589C9|nr:hypothetical protein [Nocardia terpenica]MBF6060470.1 hypothetical protein [Nocardia terpenica]MBF6103730.1 hypothetical protein [Nocardia terpenica]MBF6111896.1 hypothetical protein [Nocardia terpenica]MBF6117951.1 hypothetical protein [Nocardia terpenica]MBF6155323.1 hypothetical protein [Nocardia terpenica]